MKTIKQQDSRKNYTLFSILSLLTMFSALSHANFNRDNTTGIVTDSKTVLQWSDNAAGHSMRWEDAIIYCENMTLGACTDWRLPNFNELYYIGDRGKADPALDSVFQSVSSAGDYWSSATSIGYPTGAYTVDFYDGRSNLRSKDAFWNVLCVRGGQ